MTDYRGIPMRMRLLAALTPLLASSAFAQSITVQTVAVGDVGNAADTTGYGAVNYQYAIGKYEVTNAQYAAFLNAKAATDAYGLYHHGMALEYGGITRSGSAGSYTYSTVSGRENWAVNNVSFWDAARFTNWLQNGQGNGDTETGTYTLTLSGIANNTVIRNGGSTWAITSADEWYKAAYYKGGGLSAGYWLYPTQSNSITTAMANYWNAVGTPTAVGSYAHTSAYGAFDLGGNVYEWNEEIILYQGSNRGLLGGSFNVGSDRSLRATFVSELGSWASPGFHFDSSGFRLSFFSGGSPPGPPPPIPGPSVIAALALGSLLTRGRRRDITA